MRILISNDDGVHAKGIQELAFRMAQDAEVFVFAPDRQRSASSHGISLNRPLTVEKVDFGSSDITAFSVDGTPVDCVKLAVVLYGREKPFDLMLSGMNEGTNLATDVLYSGTVAAAGEAALQGIPSIALSLKGSPYLFEEAAGAAQKLARFFAEKDFPPDTFLNINFPAKNIDGAPWRVTRLGVRSFKDDFIREEDSSGKISYMYNGDELEEISSDEADVLVLEKGQISITPLRYRFTNEIFLDRLRTWL